MKINDFIELTSLTSDDLILGWDAETSTTRKVKISTLLDYLSANIKIPANIANTATLTASSSFNASYLPAKAVDGSISTDWASLSESNPWIQATFSTSKKISKVRIVSRIGQPPTVMTGTLTFSSGASIGVTGISNNGTFTSVDLAPRDVTWVRFTVTSGSGTNVGLGEFEVWGY
jgi:F5/8 type C domain